MTKKSIQNIPTHIIFGFLGAGKTSALLHLLKQKPRHEKWALLVNEFGEIGLDGKILEQENAEIEEIPGGCLCCASGPVFEVGLNKLIKRAKPDRLFIEPTGLGHPKTILESLVKHAFVATKPVITLVDPRKLADSRYLNHPQFMEQLEVADIIIFNKTDLCDPGQIETGERYLQSHFPNSRLTRTQHGKIPIALLDPSSLKTLPLPSLDDDQALKNDPDIHKENRSDQRYQSVSFKFEPETVFNLKALKACCQYLKVIRLKALMNTDEGWVVLNRSENDAVSISPIATSQPFNSKNEGLMELIVDRKLTSESETEIDRNQWLEAITRCRAS